jgi:hypothetical protein
MIVTPVPFDLGRLPGFREDRAAHRSVGDHVSEIIAYIMVRGGYSDKYRPGEWDQSGILKAQLGFLWEKILETAVKDMFVESAEGTNPIRQVELKHDDIYMTLDCAILDATPPRIEEYKLTKKSLAKFKADVRMNDLTRSSFAWVLQMAAYLAGATAVYGIKVRHARLVPIYLNGDYTWKPPHGDTTPYPVNIEFADTEIEEYWGMLRSNRDAMRREKAAGTWPPNGR